MPWKLRPAVPRNSGVKADGMEPFVMTQIALIRQREIEVRLANVWMEGAPICDFRFKPSGGS